MSDKRMKECNSSIYLYHKDFEEIHHLSQEFQESRIESNHHAMIMAIFV